MSFDIALSGINSVNQQISGISSNIANNGTIGYKATVTRFSAAYVQGRGNGVTVGSVSQKMQDGSISPTGRDLDVAITGRGFFVTKDSSGQTIFSRMGSFKIDNQGYLKDIFDRRVQGYASYNPNMLNDLIIPRGDIGAIASSNLSYVGKMSSDWATKTGTFNKDDPATYNHTETTTVYDSLGREHSLTQYFVKTDNNKVSVHYALDGAVPTGVTPTVLEFNTTGVLTQPTTPTELTLGTPSGANPIKIKFNYAGTTMYAGEASRQKLDVDGNPSGSVREVILEKNGNIQLQYSNGQSISLGRLALATFNNRDGLHPVNGTGWVSTGASGPAAYTTPGNGVAGMLDVRALENSNVDLTSELVNLMSAQQNYQANSKVLSTENEMIRNLMQSM